MVVCGTSQRVEWLVCGLDYETTDSNNYIEAGGLGLKLLEWDGSCPGTTANTAMFHQQLCVCVPNKCSQMVVFDRISNRRAPLL